MGSESTADSARFICEAAADDGRCGNEVVVMGSFEVQQALHENDGQEKRSL
jgi:hypothetical protein